MDSVYPPFSSLSAFRDAALLIHNHRLPRTIASEFGVPIQHARWFVGVLVGVGADIDKLATRRRILSLLRSKPELVSVLIRGLP